MMAVSTVTRRVQANDFSCQMDELRLFSARPITPYVH